MQRSCAVTTCWSSRAAIVTGCRGQELQTGSRICVRQMRGSSASRDDRAAAGGSHRGECGQDCGKSRTTKARRCCRTLAYGFLQTRCDPVSNHTSSRERPGSGFRRPGRSNAMTDVEARIETRKRPLGSRTRDPRPARARRSSPRWSSGDDRSPTRGDRRHARRAASRRRAKRRRLVFLSESAWWLAHRTHVAACANFRVRFLKRELPTRRV